MCPKISCSKNTSDVSHNTEVFLFREEGEVNRYSASGFGVPTIWLHSNGKIYIYHPLNGDTDYYYGGIPITLMQYHKISISSYAEGPTVTFL